MLKDFSTSEFFSQSRLARGHFEVV